MRGHQHTAAAARPIRCSSSNARKETDEPTTVTTPNELEIRVERIFDAPRAHVFSVWTDPKLIPEWWGDGTVVEEMDVRPGGSYRFRTAFGVVEGEFREVDAPERLVQTFQNHLQTLEFEDLGDRTKLTQTMRFATTEERDTTMQYGVEEGAKGGFARVDELLAAATARRVSRRRRHACRRRGDTRGRALAVVVGRRQHGVASRPEAPTCSVPSRSRPCAVRVRQIRSSRRRAAGPTGRLVESVRMAR